MIEQLRETDFDRMFSLMKESFPEDERRSYEEERALLEIPEFRIYAESGAKDSALQAFLAYRNFEDIGYIEHFAVNPDCRNQGLGGRILQEVMKISNRQICLEVEPPETEIARRRIGFYERNGFVYNDYVYVQPPMTEGRNPVPLRLMTTGGPVNKPEFERLKEILYTKVYHVSKDWK